MAVGAVAITGSALACALGADTGAVRASLRAGRSGLVPWGASQGLPFDTWFGPIPGSPERALPAALADHDTRQARVAAYVFEGIAAAVDDATRRFGADRVGVIVGTTTGGMGDTEQRVADLVDRGAFSGGFDLRRQHNAHATADVLAALAGVRGPTFVQSSACSSSAKVLGSARRLIALGVIDAAIVGGIDTACRYTLLGFHGLGILSASPCRPLSADRDGINLGEGAALMVVTRDHPGVAAQAWVTGVGETSDAFHATQPRPDGAGLAASIREALDQAGVAADTIDLVNAHATGTPLNDAAECTALGETLPHRPPIVGTKGWTGHTLGAAGAVEAALCVMALVDGWHPGTRTDGPTLSEGAGLTLPRDPVVGPLRRILSTSAAFAGHNAAVILERA